MRSLIWPFACPTYNIDGNLKSWLIYWSSVAQLYNLKFFKIFQNYLQKNFNLLQILK